MKKLGIGLQIFLCVLFSFIGFVNYGVWIWMAGKMRSKKMRIVGIILCSACFALLIVTAMLDGESIKILTPVLAILVLLPIVVILINIDKLKRSLNLRLLVEKNNINVQKLSEQECLFIEIPDDPAMLKISRSLFGNKGEAVLRVIAFNEKEKIDKARAEKEARIQQRKLQAEAEMAKAEAQKAQAEKAKAEAQKAQAEKAKAEADKARAEAERAKAEMQKMEAGKNRAEISHVKSAARRELESKSVSEINVSDRQVDVNLCDEQELSVVPGIGIILAKKAIRIRDEQGRFDSVDDFLKRVGIRESNIAFVKTHLICEEETVRGVEIVRKTGRKIDF